MKHSMILKFLAILLAALSVAAVLGGTAGIVVLESAGLYVNGPEDLQSQEFRSVAEDIANRTANLYAAENLGDLPYKLRKSLYPDPADRSDAAHWTVKLQEGDQVLIEPDSTAVFSMTAKFTFTPLYPIATTRRPVQENKPEDPTHATEVTEPTSDIPQETVPVETEPLVQETVDIPAGYLYRETENFWEGTSLTTYYLYYYEAPTYTVTVYMDEEVLDSSFMHLLTWIYPHRYSCIVLLGVGLILFAACMVFLCWSAGVGVGGGVHPAGLNRLPLDLYVGGAAVGVVLLIILFRDLLWWVQNEGPHPGNLSLLALNAMAISLPVIGVFTAFSAQVKVKNGYWWRHTVIGWCLCKIGQGIRFVYQSTRALFRLLPLIWRWLLTAVLMVLSVLIAVFLLAAASYPYKVFCFFLLLLTVASCAGVVCYGAYAFGTLMRGVHRMSKGDLSYQIQTKYLVGGFLDFANRLNTLSETAMLAAQREMKSERMRTELITNVSHDIKTPLTSIINFVDLLQKPHTPAQNEEYLEVLSRQSDRMKRLIEDLVELSKANSGNITVNLMPMDAEETVNQALGEFSDKLEAAELVPVFRRPEKPITMLADGKLVWRVLSNLLTNAIKYAMPGTRIYVDLMEIEGQALLSVKNVSREQMNVSADDLMERFVRGDEARNSEGSGLGLNIAKSLMEVQGGKLHLLLDGDLFKVTLIFRTAK